MSSSYQFAIESHPGKVDIDTWVAQCRTMIAPRLRDVTVANSERTVGAVAGRQQVRCDLSTLALTDCVLHFGSVQVVVSCLSL